MAGSADNPDHGPEAGHVLTFNPDHLMGTGHGMAELLGVDHSTLWRALKIGAASG